MSRYSKARSVIQRSNAPRYDARGCDTRGSVRDTDCSARATGARS